MLKGVGRFWSQLLQPWRHSGDVENLIRDVDSIKLSIKDLDLLRLNIKCFGYEIARELALKLPPRTDLSPTHIGLNCKPSTQADLESDWAAYWASQLRIPVVFHRKVWEFVFLLQGLWENECLVAGKRGLGFGCGIEPIPSYLASRDIAVTVTDLPPQQASQMGWQSTNQYTASLDHAFHAPLVEREKFDKYVDFKYVDMNAIPATLRDYDFCWSICALEHVGSIDLGLRFIENSLETVRSGGVAVHTTEYNYGTGDVTLDNASTVLFQRRHFTELAERLKARGHFVAPLDFAVGEKVLDRFIDVPPYAHDMADFQRASWINNNFHLKLALASFPSTCFGLIIRKAQ